MHKQDIPITSELANIIIEYCNCRDVPTLQKLNYTLTDIENQIIKNHNQLNKKLKYDTIISLILKNAHDDKIVSLVELYFKHGGTVSNLEQQTIKKLLLNISHDNIFEIIKVSNNSVMCWTILRYLCQKNLVKLSDNFILIKKILKYLSSQSIMQYDYDTDTDDDYEISVIYTFIKIYDEDDYSEIFLNIFLNTSINFTEIFVKLFNSNNFHTKRTLKNLLEYHDQHNIIHDAKYVIDYLDDSYNDLLIEKLTIYLNYLDKYNQRLSDDVILKMLNEYCDKSHSKKLRMLIDVNFLPKKIEGDNNDVFTRMLRDHINLR